MSTSNQVGDVVRFPHRRDPAFRHYAADGVMQRIVTDGVVLVFYVEDSIVQNEIGTVLAVNGPSSTIALTEVEHTEVRTDLAAIRISANTAASLKRVLEDYLERNPSSEEEDNSHVPD